MPKFVFSLIFASFLFACNKKSSKIDQDQIFQNYSYSFSADYFETSGFASFLVGDEKGEALKLNKKSKVSLDGKTLSEKGGFYGKSFQDKVATLSFIYTNNTGEQFNNVLEIPNEIARGTYSQLNSNDTTLWFWGGEPIDTNETAYLIFTNKKNRTQNATIAQSDVGKNYFYISPALLSTLPKETTKVEIKRQKVTQVGNFGKAGGKITTTFSGTYAYIELF